MGLFVHFFCLNTVKILFHWSRIVEKYLWFYEFLRVHLGIDCDPNWIGCLSFKFIISNKFCFWSGRRFFERKRTKERKEEREMSSITEPPKITNISCINRITRDEIALSAKNYHVWKTSAKNCHKDNVLVLVSVWISQFNLLSLFRHSKLTRKRDD